jgi:hypothetical protein
MSLISAVETSGEVAGELPMPPWVYGVLALVTFAFLLAVTWAFRGASQKYAPPRPGESHHASADAGDRQNTHHAAGPRDPSEPGGRH